MTIVHFIGLVTLVTTTSLTPAAPHLLIPRFPDVVTPQQNIIRIPSNAVDHTGTNWPFKTVGGNDEFEIKTRNISIVGAGNFTSGVVAMPHLTCCCNAMKDGLGADYEDPDAPPSEKKAAYVFLDNGQLFEFEESNKAVHYDLMVTPIAGKIEIVSDKNKPQQEKIVVNVTDGAALDITFTNQPSNDAHDGHWLSYYRMAKTPEVCTETPKKNPACGPKPNACLNTSTAKKPVTNKAARLALKKNKLHRQILLVTDINCSGSQWP